MPAFAEQDRYSVNLPRAVVDPVRDGIDPAHRIGGPERGRHVRDIPAVCAKRSCERDRRRGRLRVDRHARGVHRLGVPGDVPGLVVDGVHAIAEGEGTRVRGPGTAIDAEADV